MAHVSFESVLLRGCAVVGAIVALAPGAAPALAQAAPGGVASVCGSVMGASPGTSSYGACTDSLSRTLDEVGAARSVGRAHDACVNRGLAPGSSAMALCVVDAMHRSPLPAPAYQLAAGPAPAARSYTHMAFAERRRSEELSCANLALEPGTGAFGRCVAGLDAAMFDADHPSQ